MCRTSQWKCPEFPGADKDLGMIETKPYDASSLERRNILMDSNVEK